MTPSGLVSERQNLQPVSSEVVERPREVDVVDDWAVVRVWRDIWSRKASKGIREGILSVPYPIAEPLAYIFVYVSSFQCDVMQPNGLLRSLKDQARVRTNFGIAPRDLCRYKDQLI